LITPIPIRVNSGRRMFSLCPGESIRARWATATDWAYARFSPAREYVIPALLSLSNGDPLTGDSWLKYFNVNISWECDRATGTRRSSNTSASIPRCVRSSLTRSKSWRSATGSGASSMPSGRSRRSVWSSPIRVTRIGEPPSCPMNDSICGWKATISAFTKRPVRLASTAAFTSLPIGRASIARIATATMKSERTAAGSVPRIRSAIPRGLRRTSATIGRIARWPAAEKRASATTMVTTNPIVAATGFGRPVSVSTSAVAGPANASAAATARIHDARL